VIAFRKSVEVRKCTEGSFRKRISHTVADVKLALMKRRADKVPYEPEIGETEVDGEGP